MPSPPDRVAFSIMNVDIMWYGILITVALALAVFITYRRADKFGIKPEKVLDFSIICIPAGLIGARLYYVLFELDYYSRNPSEIINIRGGGLAIHGALILGFLTAVLLCRIWKIKTLNALDLGAPSIVIAQALGRWGNYFNQEAHGGLTDLPWGIMINGDKVHPTFLYESLWCVLVFVILLMVGKNRKFQGQIFLLYCVLYSFERFFVEHLRTDSLMLFDQYKQAQVLSVIVFILGLAAYIYLYRRGDKQDDSVMSELAGEALNAGDSDGESDSSETETDDGTPELEGETDDSKVDQDAADGASELEGETDGSEAERAAADETSELEGETDGSEVVDSTTACEGETADNTADNDGETADSETAIGDESVDEAADEDSETNDSDTTQTGETDLSDSTIADIEVSRDGKHPTA